MSSILKDESMVAAVRQMILIVALMFWQGGFMFYGGVVVPVGGRVLGSETKQGFITQSVTNYLNLAGAVCLAIWLENLWHDRRNGVVKLEWAVWGFGVVTLIVLAGIHIRMDQVMSNESTSVLNPLAFDRFHKIYIGTSSLQWLGSLAMLFCAIRRWDEQSRSTS